MNRPILNCSFLVLVLLGCLACQPEDGGQNNRLLVTLQPGANPIRVEFGGLEREAVVLLPSDYDEAKRYAVVFFFHGTNGNTDLGQRELEPLVEADDLIGIVPQGDQGSWNIGGDIVASRADDLGFTLHLLDLVGQQVTIDPSRLYAMGYSNGGAFSYHLALHSDRFAAVASLANSFFAGAQIPATVAKVSVFQINGELDTVVPYEGGRGSYTFLPAFLPALETARAWASHDGLPVDPEVCEAGAGLTQTTFRAPGQPWEVRLYKMAATTHEMGHWYVMEMQCYRDIWQFFKTHPRRLE